MIDWRRYMPGALMALGALLVVVVPGAIEESTGATALLAISFVGGMALWSGAIWYEVRKRRTGVIDERFAEIHYRAGWYAFAVTVALAITASISAANADVELGGRAVVVLVAIVGLAVYFGGVAWFRRRM